MGQTVLNQANIDYLHTYSLVPLLSKKCFQYDEDNIQCQLTKEIILFNIFFVHTSKYFGSVSVPKIFCKFRVERKFLPASARLFLVLLLIIIVDGNHPYVCQERDSARS